MGKFDVLPAKNGGTGANTIAGMLKNFGLYEIASAGIAQVEAGANFITAKIPFLSSTEGVKKYVMLHAITATMPTSTNTYDLPITFPTAYDAAPFPFLSSTVGVTSTTGGTTEGMNVQALTRAGCNITTEWQRFTAAPVYLLTMGVVTAL